MSEEEGDRTPLQAVSQVETEPDLVDSLSLGRGYRVKALVKDRVREGEIYQQQKRSETKSEGEMEGCEGTEETGSPASHCSGCRCSLLTGPPEP